MLRSGSARLRPRACGGLAHNRLAVGGRNRVFHRARDRAGLQASGTFRERSEYERKYVPRYRARGEERLHGLGPVPSPFRNQLSPRSGNRTHHGPEPSEWEAPEALCACSRVPRTSPRVPPEAGLRGVSLEVVASSEHEPRNAAKTSTLIPPLGVRELFRVSSSGKRPRSDPVVPIQASCSPANAAQVPSSVAPLCNGGDVGGYRLSGGSRRGVHRPREPPAPGRDERDPEPEAEGRLGDRHGDGEDAGPLREPSVRVDVSVLRIAEAPAAARSLLMSSYLVTSDLPSACGIFGPEPLAEILAPFILARSSARRGNRTKWRG